MSPEYPADASSKHGDAVIAWDVAAMNKRTRDCIAQHRTCDDDGYQTGAATR